VTKHEVHSCNQTIPPLERDEDALHGADAESQCSETSHFYSWWDMLESRIQIYKATHHGESAVKARDWLARSTFSKAFELGGGIYAK
jgi:uncharacterized protein (DUF2132 family)